LARIAFVRSRQRGPEVAANTEGFAFGYNAAGEIAAKSDAVLMQDAKRGHVAKQQAPADMHTVILVIPGNPPDLGTIQEKPYAD